MDEFNTIEEKKSVEVIHKKSRFIATVFHINTRNEAEEHIKQTKKKYHDARHNCVAYRVIEEDNLIEKSSDDGEPSGTAGAPMLECIRKHNLCNILVIVTRYFGGILLGTGGLVRAYTEATIKVIENSNVSLQIEGWQMEVEVEYKDIENFKYYCKKNDISIIKIEYFDYIVCKIELENKIKNKLIQDNETKKINMKQIKSLCKKIINKSVEK